MLLARALLLFSIFAVPLFAPTGVTGSVGAMRWFGTKNVTIDKTIGRGTTADVVPIQGEGISDNRVVKLYRWDLTELGPRPEGANISDPVLLNLLNGYEHVRAVLGDEAIAVDGVINWNNGNKGVILERLPLDAEFFDVKEGLSRSENATSATVKHFKKAMEKLRLARIFHNDIHVAILKDGSLKFYDSDLAQPMGSQGVRYWTNGRDPDLVMKEVTESGVRILEEVVAKKPACSHFGAIAPPHFLRTKQGSRARISQ